MNFIQDLINQITRLFTWWIIVMPWERGIRVRFGKKVTVLKEGVYLKLPIIDAIYVQTTRERVISLPIQTLTSLDGKTVSLVASIGYTIGDIELLYRNIYSPESTISNIVLGVIAEYVVKNNIEDCKPSDIGIKTSEVLRNNNFGIENVNINIIGFAIVRTYRLIQDHHWLPSGNELNVKV